MTLRIGSVCSGYEGLGMAVQAVLGGELAWVADNDPGASAILAHRFPSVPNLGDITEVNWLAVEPVEILTAGFPCQDVSCAGARKGLRAGTRTGVWSRVATAIDVLRPPLVVLENVRGLLTFGADSDLEPCPWCMGDSGDESVLRACGAVLADLADLGFDAEWLLVPAAEVGAPHRRERIFILAWPAADTEGPAWRRHGGCGSTEPGTQPGQSWRLLPEPDDRGIALADPDGAAGREWRLSAPGEAEGRGARADAGGRGGAPASDADDYAARAGCEPGDTGRRGTEPAQCRGTTADAERGTGDGRAVEPVGRSHRRDAADRDSAGRVEWGPYELAIRRWERVTGRPAPRPTEPGRTGERLSPRFVEWMMGLPEGWVTDVPGLSRNAQLKALGNGVVPAQAAMALRLLLDRADIPSLVAAEGAA